MEIRALECPHSTGTVTSKRAQVCVAWQGPSGNVVTSQFLFSLCAVQLPGPGGLSGASVPLHVAEGHKLDPEHV